MRGAELHYLSEEYNKNKAKKLYYKGKSNNKIITEEMNKDINNFDCLDLSDKDDLNAHLAFTALCLLKEKEIKLSEKNKNESNFYSAFSNIDLMSDNVQESLQRRPPCRWEVHNVLSTIVADIDSLFLSTTANNTLDASAVHTSNDDRSRSSSSTSSAVTTKNNDNEKFIRVEVVLDVGHNPAAMEALSKRIKEQYPGRGVRYVCCRGMQFVVIARK